MDRKSFDLGRMYRKNVSIDNIERKFHYILAKAFNGKRTYALYRPCDVRIGDTGLYLDKIMIHERIFNVYYCIEK